MNRNEQKTSPAQKKLVQTSSYFNFAFRLNRQLNKVLTVKNLKKKATPFRVVKRPQD